jgi:site-specific recombinase XerD
MITPKTSNIRPRRERSREHLTQEEVAKLLAATKDKSLSRNPERDHALILLMVRHGLRVSEASKLKLSDIDLQSKVMHVSRLKNGKSTTHPLYNGEVKALKDWLAVRQEMTHETPTLGSGDTVFISERRSPLSRTMIWVLVQKFAVAAGLGGLNIHPHTLRHSCGYDLANRGADTRLIQDFLGHQNIQHTVKYTALNPNRFANLY